MRTRDIDRDPRVIFGTHLANLRTAEKAISRVKGEKRLQINRISSGRGISNFNRVEMIVELTYLHTLERGM